MLKYAHAGRALALSFMGSARPAHWALTPAVSFSPVRPALPLAFAKRGKLRELGQPSTSRQPSKSRFLPAICLLLMAVFLWGYCGTSLARAAEDPARRCLADMAAAVDASDTAAFQRAVDLDTVLDQMLTVVLSEAQKPETAAQLPPLAGMMLSQAAGLTGDALRGLLRNEAKAFVLNGIASGAFAGRSSSRGGTEGWLAPMFADASTGRKEIRSVGDVRIVGNDRIVSFVLHDVGNGNDYPVVGRFSPDSSGVFRLSGVENTVQLFQRILAESRELSE